MPPPNILLITSPHWRWDVLGAAGHPDVRTPNLDALAAHGQRFSQVWGAGGPAAQALGALALGTANPGATLLSNALKIAGYRTIFCGAWELPQSPNEAGFDAAVTVSGEGGEPGYAAWLTGQGRPDPATAEAAPTYLPSFGAVRSNLSEALHVTTWIGNHAVRAVQHAHTPLFLWTHFNRPGLPYDPPAPWDERYDRGLLSLPADLRLPTPAPDRPFAAPFDGVPLTEARLRRALAFYYASISHVDQQIGRMLATLAARGRGNTVVAFSAMAGEAAGQHGLVAAPAAPLEGNLRIPLILAGLPPAHIHHEDSVLVQAEDLAPTLLDIAGSSAPADWAGRSLLPVLRGEAMSHRDTLTARAGSLRAVRDAHYKCVGNTPGPCWDLQRDPGEFNPIDWDAVPEEARIRLASAMKLAGT